MKYTRVPELSLKAYTDGSPADRKEFEDALYDGFKYFGFIILKDHKVSHELLRRAYDKSAEFFALPEDDKMPFFRPDGQRGYTPFGREHAKDSKHPDLKEFWHVGREFPEGSPLAEIYPPNVWPQKPESFRDTFLELFDALEEAGMVMLEALAPSLDVPRDFFRDMATNGNSILRLLHYPPVPDGVNPNAIRAAAHEDINLITILVAANGSGLELLDRDGNWLPVETDPDNLIVDAGDMLARVCNDKIPATTHRVVNPQDGTNESRYSMPFFMHPHSSAVLSCIESFKGEGAKYEDITADEFLKQRLREIGLA
ncbi:2-oxoglutarate and iron-dependent oxygenase domain-containing protein [Hyphococcus formosus]|uniref:isopenicillin N synthase family dioxygenase n=1 Tax=Hyphococcus formosus TaxID=3143534 RepID=UPI00398B098E